MVRDPVMQVFSDELRQINREISCPNAGGCGVVAEAIARALDERGIEHEIKNCGYDTNIDLDDVRVTLETSGIDEATASDWQAEGIGFRHLWVEFTWMGERYCGASTGVHEDGYLPCE